MKIVVGLGNPGKKYQSNRHNIGFRCIDHLAVAHAVAIKKSSCQSDVGRMKIKGEDVLLAKPRTFVNLSGEAVACLLNKYQVSIPDLIVIYDDLDLPTGRIRIRPGGSAGGHRGIKSIIQSIGDREFSRIRVGISRPSADVLPESEDAIVDYVLGDLSPAEEDIINGAVGNVADAVECIISEGISFTMNKFNHRK